MALLRAGQELPGDPLTEILPLVFNESVGKSLCEFKDGILVCECEKTSEIMKEATTVRGYEPPEGGDLPEAGKKILANAYASCRSSHPDYPKEQCSKIAWGAVHNAGYSKDTDGNWRKEKEVNEEVSEEEPEPKIKCPEGQHYDLEIKKCIPDVNEESKEMRDLRLKCSTLELSNIEKTEDTKEKEGEVNDLKGQIQKIKAEHKVERETLTNAKYVQEGVISELKNRVVNADASRDKAYEERKEIEKMMLKTQETAYEERKTFEEKRKEVDTAMQKVKDATYVEIQKVKDVAYAERMEVEKALLKEQKHSEELTQTNNEQKNLIGQQKIANENLIRQHKDVYAENMLLSTGLTDAKNREITWTKEKVQFQEDLSKALKHQKYLYEFLKKHNFEVVETTV
jgi:hypothetical protein